jgi:uncharacterized protein (TIGR00251 family)
VTESATITMRVTPRSARDEVVGWDGEVLRVRLRAPPVDGRANEALQRVLAARLEVAPSAVEIVSGQTSRTKRVRVDGLSLEEVRRRLGDAAG